MARRHPGNNLPLGHHFAAAARRISYPSEMPDNSERRRRARGGGGGGGGTGRREALSRRETSAPPTRNIIAPAPFPRADWKLSLPRDYLCSIARADISRKRGRVAPRKLFDCVSQSGEGSARRRDSRELRTCRAVHARNADGCCIRAPLYPPPLSPLSLPFYFHGLFVGRNQRERR